MRSFSTFEAPSTLILLNLLLCQIFSFFHSYLCLENIKNEVSRPFISRHTLRYPYTRLTGQQLRLVGTDAAYYMLEENFLGLKYEIRICYTGIIPVKFVLSPCQLMNLSNSRLTGSSNNLKKQKNEDEFYGSFNTESSHQIYRHDFNDLEQFELSLKENSQRMVKVFASFSGCTYLPLNGTQNSIFSLILYDIILETFLLSFIPVSCLPLILFCFILLFLLIYFLIPHIIAIMDGG